MTCIVCHEFIRTYNRRDCICDECRARGCNPPPTRKPPSARAVPLPPKVSLEDITEAFEKAEAES